MYYRSSLILTISLLFSVVFLPAHAAFLTSMHQTVSNQWSQCTPQQKYVAAGNLAVMGSAIAYRYATSKPNLLNALVKNPSAVLKNVSKIWDSFNAKFNAKLPKENIWGCFFQTIEDITQLKKQYQQLLDQYTNECPLFLLDECTERLLWNKGTVEGSEPCLLSRTYEPTYRNTFEGKSVAALVSKTKSVKNQPVHYTSFGCGDMFQDLVILTKTLTKTPDARIDIHLIDLQNAWYVAYCDRVFKTREISDQQVVTEKDLVESIEEFKKAKPSFVAPAISGDDSLVNLLASRCINSEAKCKQFISWLYKTFPQAKLSLHIHDTTDSYLKYIEKNKLSYADVITTADIDDDLAITSFPAYTKLCTKTLENNSAADNFWLIKNSQEPAIVSLSLQASSGADKVEFEDGDSTMPTVYATKEIIRVSPLQVTLRLLKSNTTKKLVTIAAISVIGVLTGVAIAKLANLAGI